MLFILVLFVATGDFKKAESTIYHNAQILTMDGQLPEATTMVVENGMVVAVGEDDLMTDSRYADFIKKDVGGKRSCLDL